jgi:hexosaminidase
MLALPNLLTLVLLITPALCLWPIPRSLEKGDTAIKLSNNFNIKVDIHHAPKDLIDAVARTIIYIKHDKHRRLVPGRGASDGVAIQQAKFLWTLTLTLHQGATIRSIAEEAVQEIGSRNESYTLLIPEHGPAILAANSTLGLFRGLTTFSQLWYELDGQMYTLEAPIKIVDSPAYVS